MSKQFIQFKDTTIYLIKTNDPVLVPFNSAIEKELFLSQHMPGTFEMHANSALEYLYIVVDIEGSGWTISKCGITYNHAMALLKHYL